MQGTDIQGTFAAESNRADAIQRLELETDRIIQSNFKTLDRIASLVAKLRTGPSSEALWITVADLSLQRGNYDHAHALLRRACASSFPSRVAAQRHMAELVAEAYKDG